MVSSLTLFFLNLTLFFSLCKKRFKQKIAGKKQKFWNLFLSGKHNTQNLPI